MTEEKREILRPSLVHVHLNLHVHMHERSHNTTGKEFCREVCLRNNDCLRNKNYQMCFGVKIITEND